jgi:hypothetical protein
MTLVPREGVASLTSVVRLATDSACMVGMGDTTLTHRKTVAWIRRVGALLLRLGHAVRYGDGYHGPEDMRWALQKGNVLIRIGFLPGSGLLCHRECVCQTAAEGLESCACIIW